jgi:hypothetical protein
MKLKTKIKEFYNKLTLSAKIVILVIISIIVISGIHDIYKHYQEQKFWTEFGKRINAEFAKSQKKKEEELEKSMKEALDNFDKSQQLELQRQQLQELQGINNKLDDIKRKQRNEY